MTKRIYLAGLFHETHGFVSDKTGLDQFRRRRDGDIMKHRGDGSQIDGVLEVAERRGWRIVPGPDYGAMPSGVVEHAVFEAFWRDVEATLVPALAQGLDAIYLALHGAMVTDGCHDPEGELLARIRALPGAADLPIFGVFDLHAVFTARMAALSNGLVGYRENPHVDARESAMRGADLLARALETGRVPRTFWRHPPIIWPPTGTGSADTPVADLERLARAIEAENPEIWAVNVVPGFAFADVPDAGVSFTVVTVGDEAAANRALARLADCAWTLRAAGVPRDRPVDDVLRDLKPSDKGPILLVEPSDNIGGGAAGDGTGVLRALVRHRTPRSAVVIADPEAVAALQAVAIGGRTALAIGGKRNRIDEGPLPLDVELISRSDGRFTLEDRQSHLAASQGTAIDMGPCAVVRHEGVTILLTSRKTPPFDLGQLRSQGIEPRALAVIGVKAAVAHRRAYDPIAAASFTVATPGPCASDLSILPYRNLRRPIFPLDPLPELPKA
ncbi:MAG: M81 family metallopeptidase [Alphaproteobacteria bacterium]|nr:M81 family metallopeptidase [Alphaproteobacteria bacterium]